MSQASNLDTTQRTFDGANRFGLQLLLQLAQEQPRERNFVVSPVSVQLALSMAYAGAEGATADAMANTLGWGGTSRERLLELQSALQTSLKSPGSDIVLRIASAVWRPFVFAIVDQSSHTILFVGILGDPEGAKS